MFDGPYSLLYALNKALEFSPCLMFKPNRAIDRVVAFPISKWAWDRLNLIGMPNSHEIAEMALSIQDGSLTPSAKSLELDNDFRIIHVNLKKAYIADPMGLTIPSMIIALQYYADDSRIPPINADDARLVWAAVLYQIGIDYHNGLLGKADLEQIFESRIGTVISAALRLDDPVRLIEAFKKRLEIGAMRGEPARRWRKMSFGNLT
ncbi:MAG: hypothetical protein KatS3mg054_0143 [Chloroflexus sp.]|nr:MAG: hypothetical protein KatS3mg054_0143 [Chloroflexus sp.]